MPSMVPPINYLPNFFSKEEAEKLFERLRDDLAWIQHPDAPRAEYYVNEHPEPYIYGRGQGRRKYEPQEWTPEIMEVQRRAEDFLDGALLNVCFLNRYDDARKSLGWHADDSPEMDPKRPIAIVSFGEEREIWFRPKGSEDPSEITKLMLGHGSLCVMAAGMQQAWEHKIPKASFVCKRPRISMTFRGFLKIDPG